MCDISKYSKGLAFMTSLGEHYPWRVQIAEDKKTQVVRKR